MTFVTTVFLKMAVWKYTCYQSMMKIKHSNVNLWLQFSYKGSLTKHIASVHNAKKSFKFDICDHSLSKKSNLKKHIGKVHEIKKHFTCNQSYLQKESSLKSYLKRHILLVHDEKTKLFKCSICEANFSLKRISKRHSFSPWM